MSWDENDGRGSANLVLSFRGRFIPPPPLPVGIFVLQYGMLWMALSIGSMD